MGNMGLPTVEKCCACLELKTGTLILGVINLVGSIILAIISAVGLAGSAVLASGALDQYIDKDSRMDSESRAAVNTAATFGIVVTSIMLIIYILYVVVASMLIHGARKEKPGLMMPWIVLTIVYLIWDIVQIIGYFVSGDWLSAIIGIILFCPGFYFFICVWSYRKQLQE